MNDALPEGGSEQEWQKALDAMLVKEKELTRWPLHDAYRSG